MVIGDMLNYLSGIHSGIPHHVSVMPSLYVGGYGNPNTVTQQLTLDFDVTNTLLSIVITGKDLRWRGFMWKVSLGRVTLTREFKPQVIARGRGFSRAAMVFDVSKIVSSPGKYDVKVMCESAEPVRIDSITLLGIHSIKGMSSEIGYWVGPLGLDGRDEYRLPLRNKFKGPAQVQFIITSQTRTSGMEVILGGLKKALNHVLGTDLVSLKLDVKEENSMLKFRHEGMSHVFVDEILYYKPLTKGPILELKDVALRGDVLEMSLVNRGSLPAFKVLVVGISAGIPVFRKLLERVDPGPSPPLSVKVEPDLKKPLIIRLIYYGVWGQEVKSYPIL